jgi:ABC-type multidrug transport system permease subunit
VAEHASLGAIAWSAVGLAAVCCFVTSAGFAVAFAGLVLVFRRVSVLMMPVSVLLMGVMMSPPGALDAGALRALPYVAAKRLLARGLGGAFDASLAGWALGVAVLVGALGLATYVALERRARATGQLSIA